MKPIDHMLERIVVEPSRVDGRWCVDSGDCESLMPSWVVPFYLLIVWRRIRKRHVERLRKAVA